MNKYALFLLAVLSLACGQTVALPTATVTPTAESVSTEIHVYTLPTRTPTAAPVLYVCAAQSLNVRACAGTDCAGVGVLAGGAEVAPTGAAEVKEDLSVWQPVSAGDVHGYVNRAFLCDAPIMELE
jgi:hypothetical protein